MTLNDLQKQIEMLKSQVEKALLHLEFSFAKVKAIPEDFDIENYDILEVFESFTSRFARLSDIVIAKLMRSFILKDDPSFQGGFMDSLNQGEKLRLISDARRWWLIRSLRNKEAHEYTDEDLRFYFKNIKSHCQFVIDEAKNLLQKS